MPKLPVEKIDAFEALKTTEEVVILFAEVFNINLDEDFSLTEWGIFTLDALKYEHDEEKDEHKFNLGGTFIVSEEPEKKWGEKLIIYKVDSQSKATLGFRLRIPLESEIVDLLIDGYIYFNGAYQNNQKLWVFAGQFSPELEIDIGEVKLSELAETFSPELALLLPEELIDNLRLNPNFAIQRKSWGLILNYQ